VHKAHQYNPDRARAKMLVLKKNRTRVIYSIHNKAVKKYDFIVLKL